MIYREKIKEPIIQIENCDFRDLLSYVSGKDNVIVVTDPPFNIGYHYKSYKDKMQEKEYFKMLSDFMNLFPCVFIHYPETLHRISIETGVAPTRVVSWVYNSNTPRQHRDVAFYGVIPCFKNTLQPYKNPNDKRIKERISRGILGGGYV